MPIRYKPTDPQGQQEAISRRRALADRLQQPEPVPQDWSRQPIYPGMSSSAAAARLASVLIGKFQGRKATKDQDALDTAKRKAYADQLRGLVSHPIQPGEPGSGVLQPGAQAPLSPQQEAAVSSIGSMPLEQQGPLVAQLGLSKITPQKPAEVSAGASLVDPTTGKELFHNQAAATGGNSRYGNPQIGPDGNIMVLDRASGQYADTGKKASANQRLVTLPDGSVISVDMRQPSTGGAPTTAPVVSPETALHAKTAAATAEAEAKAGVIPADERVTAQNKEPRLEAAARRLQRVSEASQALEGNTILSGGPLQGGVIGLTEKGGELDQANAQLLTELTALTRTPGLGSQSDFEQRLAQLVLPTANMYPSVRKKAVAELESFIGDLGAQIRKIGSGNAAPAGQTAQPAQPAQPPQGVDPETWKFLTPEERALWR